MDGAAPSSLVKGVYFDTMGYEVRKEVEVAIAVVTEAMDKD